MRKLILITAFLLFFLTHSTWRTAQNAYAFWWDKSKKDEGYQAAALRVIETANERLKQRIEELSKENAELNDKNLKIQAEITGLSNDRIQVLDRLKVITEESAKFKEQIGVLQKAMVVLDEKNKQTTTENRQMIEDKNQTTGRIKELERELQPVIKVKDELNKKIKELELKVVVQDGEGRKWQDKAEKLENEKNKLEKEKKQAESFIDKLQEKQKAILKERSEIKNSLSNTVSDLTGANKKLKRLEKETGDMHYNLAVIFQSQNKFDEAIREYEKVLETKPDDADANFNLALIYDSVKNDRDKAIQHYEEYLGINPNGETAAKIKERITQLGLENKIWGDPGAKNVKEKKGRW